MTEVISIRFNCRGKAYFFDPNGVTAKPGDKLIVETSKGLDMGECAIGNHEVDDESLLPPLRPVIRVATEADMKTVEKNKALEREAFKICKEKISQHGLEMKLVGVECGFEGNKILFFFTADGRVDFRELVKDLAAVFRTRIELRQIGVRDETKMLGGLGICGKPYCCSQFLNDFQPVSTKMAKTQSMSLNPTKISGSCGRLMCCLRYEQDAYEDLIKTIPKNGAFVQTIGGYGNVVQTNVLRQKVKVRIDGEGEPEIKTFEADEVATVPGGRPKLGDPMPEVLNYVARPKETAEPEDDPWKAPNLFADQTDPRKAAAFEPRPEFGEEEKRAEQPRRPQPPRPRGNNAPRKGAPQNQGGKRPQKPMDRKPAPPQGAAPKPQPQNAQPKAEGAPKSGGNNRPRRRHYQNKPKGGAPQGGAPKGE